MKLQHIIISTIVAASLTFWTACGQVMSEAEAANPDISDNLDLRAVTTVFGQSENLEDFERRLNDPELKISNLDLNEDGYVDYLRVIEVSEDGTHMVLIQAVIGEDQYQDVATIDLEKDDSGETTVQVVGNAYVYGPDYVIEPVYSTPPVIYVYLWGPYYSPWYSPYYWGYYPAYYNPWHPYSIPVYVNHVHVYTTSNTYTYVGHRGSRVARNLHRSHRRTDYKAMASTSSFTKRNAGAKNKHELAMMREEALTAPKTKNGQQKDGKLQRRVDPNWKPNKDRKPSNKMDIPKNADRPKKFPSEQDRAIPSEQPSRLPRNQKPRLNDAPKQFDRSLEQQKRVAPPQQQQKRFQQPQQQQKQFQQLQQQKRTVPASPRPSGNKPNLQSRPKQQSSPMMNKRSRPSKPLQSKDR